MCVCVCSKGGLCPRKGGLTQTLKRSCLLLFVNFQGLYGSKNSSLLRLGRYACVFMGYVCVSKKGGYGHMFPIVFFLIFFLCVYVCFFFKSLIFSFFFLVFFSLCCFFCAFFFF